MENNTQKNTPPNVQKNNVSPAQASDLCQSMSLDKLQTYISTVVKQRGFDKETPRDITLLMVEEVGELAKAIRKITGLKIDQNKANSYTTVEEEVADVFFYLLDLCASLNIDLFTALKNKELRNEKRFFATNPNDIRK